MNALLIYVALICAVPPAPDTVAPGSRWETLRSYFETTGEDLDRDPADFVIDRADLDFYGYGKYRLKTFDFLVTQPSKTGPFMEVMARTLVDNADSLWFLMFYPWARIDEGVRRGLIERPEPAARAALDRINDIKRELADVLVTRLGAVDPDVRGLNDSAAAGMLLVVREISNSINWIRQSQAGVSADLIDSVLTGLVTEQEDGLDNRLLERMIDHTDFKSLASGAMDLGYILQTALGYLRDGDITTPVAFDTRYGRIAIGSRQDDVYARGPYSLIIDFGGDDDYTGAGVTDPRHPVSIVIDCSGDDRYHGRIGPGSGIAGFAVIIDEDGNDSYISERIGLGTGIFGLGLIMDRAGDDFYSGDLYCQGAGLFGGGVLADLAGDDEYACFQCGQGFGFVKGCGILVDRSGDDVYAARDDTVRYPSAQSAIHNSSLAQGFGFGIRADFTDGHSLAGGIGILVDGMGDDRYDCGVFGQGGGYWFGAGFLVDLGGRDEYRGIWYTQGAAAHFALGGLLDRSGDDTYRTEINMGPGAGHDFSLGVLFDLEGDDRYEGGGLALGAGNANGMGILADFQGNDTYRMSGTDGLGYASRANLGGMRDYMRCLGFFFDGAGADTYPLPAAADQCHWTLPGSGPDGIGIDF